ALGGRIGRQRRGAPEERQPRRLFQRLVDALARLQLLRGECDDRERRIAGRGRQSGRCDHDLGDRRRRGVERGHREPLVGFARPSCQAVATLAQPASRGRGVGASGDVAAMSQADDRRNGFRKIEIRSSFSLSDNERRSAREMADDAGTLKADEARPDLGFDPAALRAKYQAERDKRLRADGNEQYVEIAGRFAHYLDDPYVAPISRAPLTDEVEVAVIGGGFGGLLAGARLREAGVDDIRMIEKGGDFGGTWYWNRYPGAACDIESYIYLPLLEELGYIPKEKYSHAPEILAHSRAIAEHFDLYANACLETEVTGLHWDDDDRRWIVSTNR